MLDRDADDGRARVMAERREQPPDPRFLIRKPVALATGGVLIAGDRRDLFDRGREKRRAAGAQDGMEIDPLERTTVAIDEARRGAAAGAQALRAIDRDAVRREGHLVELDDMRAGTHALEMIASVAIGDGVAAVFHHEADSRHAGARCRIDVTAAVDHPADDGQALADRLAADTHQRVGDIAEIARRAAGAGAVEGVAGLRAGAHFEHISKRSRSARRERGERKAELAVVGHGGIGEARAIESDAIAAQPHLIGNTVAHRQHASRGKVGIAHDHSILDQVAAFSFIARGGLDDYDRGQRTVERNINPHRRGAGQHDVLPERARHDHERSTIGTTKRGKLRRWNGRGEAVRSDRFDKEPIRPAADERKAIIARGKGIYGATAVGDGLAGDHARGIE